MKTLWGYSENAVKVHLWAAIITYLTVARIKADYKSPYSITEVDLRTLITKQDDSIISNQNVKERTLFDDI